jgi:C4-dicarboxylate-specific signal transduction histidine kinase
MISRIRVFVRKGSVTKEPIDVNEVIREMDIILRNEVMQNSVFVHLKLSRSTSHSGRSHPSTAGID